ncbi:MAG: diguanylate cyclase [Lachnospiraceae bacterium]|nr:diguanylate cyclase [Lachnospiraceae bacterium]
MEQNKDIDFEKIVSELKVGVLVVKYGSEIKIEYANDYFYEITGYSRNEYEKLFNNNITPRIYPDDVQKLKANVSRQLQMGGNIRYEFRIIKKDGSIAWLSINGTKHYSDVLRLRVCVSDITESKTLYNDIAEKNLELDTIYNNIHGGLIKIYLPEFRVVYANNGFYDIIGYTKEEFLHKFNNVITDLVPVEDLERLTELSTQCPSIVNYNVRTIAPNGDINWNILNASRIGSLEGKPLYLCTIIDISENKKYEEKLEFQQKKNRIITELSGEWMWEYDIASDTLTRRGAPEIFKDDRVVGNYRQNMLDSKIVHEEDIKIFNELCDAMALGKNIIEEQFRMRTSETEDSFSWFKAVGTTLYDADGDAICVIGKTSNIDETHEHLAILEDKASRDSLTQIYNRTEFQNIVEEKLAAGKDVLPSALILADIDNFRSINDSLGHLFGDSVLIEVSNILTTMFPNDIVGRVGTDVFAVFIEKASSRKYIDGILDQVDKLFSKIYSADKDEYKITCSIGIEYTESVEPTYEVMFKKADIALFTAKDNGKNVHVYYEESQEFGAETRTLNEYNMKESFSSLQESIDSALVTSAIDLLFDAKDTISAVKILLAKMREHFDAEYIMISTLKESRNGNYSTKEMWIPNSFKISQKSPVAAEVVEQHLSLFNNDMLFYCSDISTINSIAPLVYEELTKNGTQSVLQCANIRNGKLCGFVSIATCSDATSWNVGDVRTFTILCKILFSAIVKVPIK